jgi:hypothetical protein
MNSPASSPVSLYHYSAVYPYRLRPLLPRLHLEISVYTEKDVALAKGRRPNRARLVKQHNRRRQWPVSGKIVRHGSFPRLILESSGQLSGPGA